MTTEARSEGRSILLAAAPAAGAIAIFGVIYGSLARPLMGVPLTLLSSFFIFSGAVQFTIAALLSAGAAPAAIVAGATTLNLRNLLLGAVLRPHIGGGRARRAGLAWFMVDESAGLALAAGPRAGRTMLLSGLLFYTSWQIGTAAGLLGASVEGVRDAAEAVFPVLFVGLAAMSARTMDVVVRSFIAGALTFAIATTWPDARAFVAVIAAVAVAVVRGPR